MEAAGNFVALAECGFYDGSVFHRLVPGFVIQGGARTGGGEAHLHDKDIGTPASSAAAPQG